MEKRLVYEEALREAGALLEGEEDLISRMSTICSVLSRHLPQASWIGFYRVVSEGMLAVGPYQGAIGCLRIPFDKGVCGAAARTGRPQIVPDVRRFPGHIACDESARSEIVLPVLGSFGELIAVLDLDSRSVAAFDEVDREYLERMARLAPPVALR